MMKNKKLITSLVFLSILSHTYVAHSSSAISLHGGVREVEVGVILDTESWLGKVVQSCINMSVSDFYALNGHYKTRLVLHTRDSKGEPFRALSAALDLLQNIKVQALIGPETVPVAKFLAILGEKARIPILSLTTNPLSSTQHPYNLQVTHCEATQFEGIATVIESYRWREVILIFEDTDYDREIVPYILDSFQERSIQIAYKSPISPLATDDQIFEELHKIMMMQSKIFVLHVSPSLASRILLSTRRLGMMREGYAWIITDKTMNMLNSVDLSVIETMQGALGFKPYIPPSKKLRNFTIRWRKKFLLEEPNMEVMSLNVFGIRAYDALWALARAVESVGVQIPKSMELGKGLDLMNLTSIKASQIGPTLLHQMKRLRFDGLSSEFRILNGKLVHETYEIVNILGTGERRVGFCKSDDGISKEMDPQVNKLSSSKKGLEAIIWPGGSTKTPKGYLGQMHGKRLRIAIVPGEFGFPELLHANRDPQTNDILFTGFCIDVFEAAISFLEYEVTFDFIPFVDANGQSSGS